MLACTDIAGNKTGYFGFPPYPVMRLQLPDDPQRPLYRRIADAIRDAVIAGQVMPGDRLPARLALAKTLGVNPLTVRRAYELLQNEGVLVQKPGSGTYLLPDALGRIERSGRRQVTTLVIVIGERSLAKFPRQTLFIFSDILDGLREVLGDREAHYVFVESLTEECVAELGPGSAVMMLYSHEHDPVFVQDLLRRNVPVLCAWEESPAYSSALPRVTYDGYHSAALACNHLVDCGYRRIGFIGRTSYPESTRIPKKYFAYMSELQKRGLDIYNRYVRYAELAPGEAYAAVSDMISDNELPEAFFIDTDYKAMEVVAALRAAGLRVPEDVAIAAYDDIPEASVFDPPLTTVRTPRHEIGRRSAELLLSWPAHGPPPEGAILLPELKVRASTRTRDTTAAAPAASTEPTA